MKTFLEGLNDKEKYNKKKNAGKPQAKKKRTPPAQAPFMCVSVEVMKAKRTCFPRLHETSVYTPEKRWVYRPTDKLVFCGAWDAGGCGDGFQR